MTRPGPFTALRFTAALMLLLVAAATVAPSVGAGPLESMREREILAGLGDSEVCAPDTYLGRIEVGDGYAVGDEVSNDGFTLRVDAIKDAGEIIGFTITDGTYSYLVVHAGGGQDVGQYPGPTVSDLQFGLSFVAFCGQPTPTPTSTEVPTETATEVPTETATEVPTETATEVPTETATEVPTETATEVPTETATEVPTEAATETPTEVATEAATETATEVPTETATEVPTEAATETATEVPTEVPTETVPATFGPATEEATDTPVVVEETETATVAPTNTAGPDETQAAVDETPVATTTGVAVGGGEDLPETGVGDGTGSGGPSTALIAVVLLGFLTLGLGAWRRLSTRPIRRS